MKDNRSAQARLLLEQAGNEAVYENVEFFCDERGIPSCVDVTRTEGTLLLSPDARRVLEETLLNEDTKE